MPNTPKLKLPYPSENQTPWFDSFVGFAEAVDQTFYANREDRNLVLTGGGNITFHSATIPNLAWDAPFSVLSPITGFQLQVAAGSINMSDGQAVWLDLTRAPTQNLTTVLQTSNQVPSSDTAYLIAYRSGNAIMFRNGQAWADNTTASLGASTKPVPITTILAKGDLLAGTGPEAITNVSVGPDGQVLVADSTQPGGVNWAPEFGIVTTKGDLIVGTGPALVMRVAAGANGQQLTANSSQASGVAWVDPITYGLAFARNYGLVCDGATNDYAALSAMVTTLGSTSATIVIPGPCLVGTNITIPTNLPVRFEGTGAFTGAGVVTYTKQGGGVADRRTLPDASDLLVYTFDEAVSPFANTGGAGTTGNNLTLSNAAGGQGAITMPGLFSNGLNLGNGIDFNTNSSVFLDGASTVEPVGPLTVTIWYWPRSLTASMPFVMKGYAQGAVVDPFWSVGFDFDDTLYPRLSIKVTGQTARYILRCVVGRPIAGAWNYLGFTYDAAGTVQFMLNGKIIQTFPINASAIDWGTHGNWSVGTLPTGNNGIRCDGVIDEFRLANVVRPASYFASVWKTGMRL